MVISQHYLREERPTKLGGISRRTSDTLIGYLPFSDAFQNSLCKIYHCYPFYKWFDVLGTIKIYNYYDLIGDTTKWSGSAQLDLTKIFSNQLFSRVRVP